MEQKRILIIGAGIGGLCLAAGLRRTGHDVAVFERAGAFGDVGAGLTLWANAVKALEKLGIPGNALNACRFRRAQVVTSNGRLLYGSDMDEMEQKLGAPTLAVHRADLHRALLAALPEGSVQTGVTFEGFTQDDDGVRAVFSGGKEERGDLLVGADGIHSVVRQALFPQVRLRYAGYPAWRGVVQMPDVQASQQTTEMWGCGARFGIVPLSEGRAYWFATANLPAGLSLSPTDRKADLQRRFQGWHGPVAALIGATPETSILYNDIFDFPPMLRWSQGRVTLLGDAAHATTPNLGQGACQAIESAVSLSRGMAEEETLEAALSRYEAERHSRTAWITNTSWQMGQVAQLENRHLCQLRDMVVRSTPKAVLRGQMLRAAAFEI